MARRSGGGFGTKKSTPTKKLGGEVNKPSPRTKLNPKGNPTKQLGGPVGSTKGQPVGKGRQADPWMKSKKPVRPGPVRKYNK